MKLSFSLCLPQDEMSIPVVRHLLGGSLRKLGATEGGVSDIELALTEACTNVLRHASAEDDEYMVEIEIAEGVCEIRVFDTGRGFDHSALKQAAASAEGGRGVQLMNALADTVNFESKPGDGMIVRLVKRLEITRGSPLGRLTQAVS
jgi:serine/threonine-protein kinase RsbW